LSHCPCRTWNLPAALSCLTFPPFCPDIPFCVGCYNIKFLARHQSCSIQSCFPGRNSCQNSGAPIFVSNCQIELNCLIDMRLELAKCQIESVLPYRIAKSNCRNAKLNCRIELPNQVAKSSCQIKLPNRIAQSNC
jgi:hypothetical protein